MASEGALRAFVGEGRQGTGVLRASAAGSARTADTGLMSAEMLATSSSSLSELRIGAGAVGPAGGARTWEEVPSARRPKT